MGWPYEGTLDGSKIELFPLTDSEKLENVLKEMFEQEQASKPKKIRTLADLDKKQYTPQDRIRLLRTYIQNKVTEKLNTRFGPVEEMEQRAYNRFHPGLSYEHSIDDFNRGTLLIVDGKTVGELMMETYISELPFRERKEASMDSARFRAWYHKNLKQLSSKFVFDALLAGKPVVAYLPEAAGGMPKRFVQLKLGQVLEEFLNIPQQADTQTQAMKDAGIRLRANCRTIEAQHLHPDSAFVRDLFGVKDKKDDMAVPICIGLMSINNGRSIQDIVDSPKLQEQILSKAFDQQLLDKPLAIYTVDKEKLGEFFYKSHVLLHHQMNLMMKGKDLSKPEVRDEVVPYLHLTSQVLSKMIKYLKKNKDAQDVYNDLVKQAGNDVKNMPQQIDNVSALCQLMHEADEFRAMMGRPLSFHNDEHTMKKGLAAQITEYGILRSLDPTKPFIEQCPSRETIDAFKKNVQEMKNHQNSARCLSRGWERDKWIEGANLVVSDGTASPNVVECKHSEFQFEDNSTVFNRLNQEDPLTNRPDVPHMTKSTKIKPPKQLTFKFKATAYQSWSMG